MFYHICVDLQTIWKWNIKYMLQLHWCRSSDYHSKGEANLFLIELSCFCQASGSSRPPLMGFPPRPSTCRWEGQRSLNTHQMVLKNRAVCLKRKYQDHCLFFRSGREKNPITSKLSQDSLMFKGFEFKTEKNVGEIMLVNDSFFSFFKEPGFKQTQSPGYHRPVLMVVSSGGPASISDTD